MSEIELVEFQSLIKKSEKNVKDSFAKLLKDTGNDSMEIVDTRINVSGFNMSKEYVDMDLAIVLTLRMKK